MNLKITLIDKEFILDVTEKNYKIVLLKLLKEKEYIVNLLKSYKEKGLINSIKKPVDKTLIRGKISHRVKRTNTELQNSLDNLIRIKQEITKTIEQIHNIY
jgi:hypothetical protein